MRRWTSWWLALQQPAGGRSQMANGEGREGRWWPVGGLARTKPAALRATRLHPCVVTLGLASSTPRRRPLNIYMDGDIDRRNNAAERCSERPCSGADGLCCDLTHTTAAASSPSQPIATPVLRLH